MKKFLILYVGVLLISCGTDLEDLKDTIIEESYTIEKFSEYPD